MTARGVRLTTRQLRRIGLEIERLQGHAHIYGTPVPGDTFTVKQDEFDRFPAPAIVTVIDGPVFTVTGEGEVV